MWTLDDAEVARMPTPADYSQPAFALLNLAVGGPGSWPATQHGEPDPSVNSAVLRVASYAEYALGSWSASKLIPTTLPVPR